MSQAGGGVTTHPKQEVGSPHILHLGQNHHRKLMMMPTQCSACSPHLRWRPFSRGTEG